MADTDQFPDAAVQALFYRSLVEQQKTFKIWRRRAFWTPEEATALLMGTIPEAVTNRFYQYLPAERAEQFENLLEDIRRRFEVQVIPAELLLWAEANGVTVPQGLSSTIHLAKEPRPSDEKRSTNTLLKVILAMAIDKYNYDPDKLKNSTVKQIKGATENIGLAVSDSTLRDILKNAAALDDFDWSVVKDR